MIWCKINLSVITLSRSMDLWNKNHPTTLLMQNMYLPWNALQTSFSLWPCIWWPWTPAQRRSVRKRRNKDCWQSWEIQLKFLKWEQTCTLCSLTSNGKERGNEWVNQAQFCNPQLPYLTCLIHAADPDQTVPKGYNAHKSWLCFAFLSKQTSKALSWQIQQSP